MSGETHTGSIHDAPKVVGLPGTNGTSESVQQHYQDTCAVRSQELVLRDFGVQISEDSLRNEAMSKGWYTPGCGTDVNSVGNLLESHGVSVHRYQNADIISLTSELAQGHKVIVGVDSGELQNHGLWEEIKDNLGFQQANHALLVSGIDTSDPDHVKVILTDPGTGDIAKAYPIEQFVESWKDSSCFMVATAEPAPLAYNPEMVNFDYSAHHLSSIGQVPYEVLDHHLLELSNNLGADNFALDLLHDDFANMVSGQTHSLSPDLLSSLEQTSSAHHSPSHSGFELVHHSGDHIAGGTDIIFEKGMANYYEDWTDHHENHARYDIEHVNPDHADDHHHAQDALQNDHDSV